MCSNLFFTLFCVCLRWVSNACLPNRTHVTLFTSWFNRDPSKSNSVIFLVAVKRPIEKAHRRVVDSSENVTPSNRYELPMGTESPDRGFEIPIESQVGNSPTNTTIARAR